MSYLYTADQVIVVFHQVQQIPAGHFLSRHVSIFFIQGFSNFDISTKSIYQHTVIPRFTRLHTWKMREFAGSPQEYKYVTLTVQRMEALKLF